jgi:hypothetical protein
VDIRKLVYWSKIRKDVEKYVKTCHKCQVNKPYCQVTSAPLQLMVMPESQGESIYFDFITNLPKSKGYDSILVIVYYLSKIAHLIPTHTTADAVKIAELFFESIFRQHVLPKVIISSGNVLFNFQTGTF